MLIFSSLIGLSALAFVLAYMVRNKNLPPSLYDGILCFGGAVILGVTVFDFIPHLYVDFPFLAESQHQHDLHHDHQHNHQHNEHWNGLKFGAFGLLLVIGFVAQFLLEKSLGKKQTDQSQHLFLVLGLFLHSFSETVVLQDELDHINKALFTGILFHKLPISFILAYTLLSTTTLKNSLLGFGFFVLSIPMALVSHFFMIGNPAILNPISVLVSGVLLHVVWHLFESLKTKSLKIWGILALGLGFGYAITLFHTH